jgi:hypothetical protein
MPNFELLTGNWLDQELGTQDSTVLFTSTRRAQAVNDGVSEFAELTECLLRVSTVACSCNVTTYDLLSSAVNSTDFVRLAPRGVEFHLLSSGASPVLQQLAGDDFPRRDIEVLNREDPGWRQSTSPSFPTGYYVDQANGKYLIGLDWPPRVGSSETAKLIVPYIARPVPMTSTGDIPFTVGGNVRTDLIPFHKAPVHFAAAQLEKLRGDTDASDRQMATFLSYVQRYSEKFKNKGENFVRLAKNYLSDASRSRRRGGSGVGGTFDPRRDFV